MLKLFHFFIGIVIILFSGCGSSDSNQVSTPTAQAVFSTSTLDNNNLKLLIPMYVYPKSNSIDWKDLLDFKRVNPKSDITIIVNPDNGEFTTENANYIQAIQNAKAEGIRVIGYVYTMYGQRDISKVEDNINSWRDLYKKYGVSGVFFDEASHKKEDLDYYRTLSQYARGEGLSFIVLNAGTLTDSSYLDSDIADVIVDFESDYTDFIKDTVQWNEANSYTELCSMVYGVDSDSFLAVIERLKDAKQQYIYLTENKHAYAWNTLSKYVFKVLQEAPSSSSTFKGVLSVSKLQAPTSSYDERWGTLYGEFEGVSNRYFYLHDNAINLRVCDLSARSELRFQEDWKTSTSSVKSIEARLEVLPLTTEKEFTFMQIHSDATLSSDNVINSPLIRIVWRKDYNGMQNHLWAIIKLDDIEDSTEYKKVDLGVKSESLFTLKLQVQNNQMSLWLDGGLKVDKQDVSYWQDYPSYFKVGVYMQSKGCASSVFSAINL